MDILQKTLLFVVQNMDQLAVRLVEHILLVTLIVGLALLVGIPLGIAINRNPKAAQVVLLSARTMRNIPAISLFAVLLPILAKLDWVSGYWAAVITALLGSQLPIIRNTYTALRSIDPALHEVAKGMGLSGRERLRLLEAPLAIPFIVAGVRRAAVLTIGVVAISAYIGVGGLGVIVREGIAAVDPPRLIVGALLLGVLATMAHYSLLWVQRRLTSVGLRRRAAEFGSL